MLLPFDPSTFKSPAQDTGSTSIGALHMKYFYPYEMIYVHVTMRMYAYELVLM